MVARNIPGRLFVHNLIVGRSLIYQLVRRDFEQRYVGSIAGWLWGIIHPLTLLAVYTFVFQYAFGIKLDPAAVTDIYPLYLFCGMLPWMLFSETLQRSATSLVDNANLLKKSVFPSETIPLSIFLSGLASHALALVLAIGATAIWAGTWSPMLWILPLYLVLLALFSVGLAWIIAALQVYLRDTAQVLTVVLTAWFWLTPIFIEESRMATLLPGVMAWNPLTYFVRSYRDTILGGQLPALADVGAMAGFGVASCVVGGLFFRHAKRGFADVL